jgi:hypothetical protein
MRGKSATSVSILPSSLLFAVVREPAEHVIKGLTSGSAPYILSELNAWDFSGTEGTGA